MSVPEARRRLQNTSGMSSEQVSDLRQVIDQFYAAQPRKACAACSCMVWEEHTSKDGDACWACASCHRPPTLTSEAWSARVVHETAATETRLLASEAAAPKPRAPGEVGMQR